MMSIEQLIAENHRLQKELDISRTMGATAWDLVREAQEYQRKQHEHTVATYRNIQDMLAHLPSTLLQDKTVPWNTVRAIYDVLQLVAYNLEVYHFQENETDDVDSTDEAEYNHPIVTNQEEEAQMETFDDISCEEYNAVWGTDEEQFQE